MEEINKEKRKAFVYSGGGAFAVPELGFSEYATKFGYFNPKLDIAVGTSFGAITAASTTLQMRRREITQMLDDFYHKTQNAFTPFSLFIALFNFSFRWGLADLIDLLAPYFGAKDFPKNLRICATDLEIMKPHFWDYTQDISLLEAVASSASIPILFRPIKIKQSYYVDGGFVEQLPTSAVPSNYQAIITGTYPSSTYHHNITDFGSYISGLIDGPIYFLNSYYTKKLPNATMVILKSKASGVLDFSHWLDDYQYGYEQAKLFFKQYSQLNP